MINEVMAKAVTGIDDKLILDAEAKIRKKPSFRPIYGVCALAACLVLVFTFIFSAPKAPAVPELFMDNAVIGSSPVNLNSPATVQSRETNQLLYLNLSLKISEETEISVSHGTMNICSSGNTDTLLYSGIKYTTDKPVSIHWYLDGTDINSVYTLTLNDSIIYTLSYDDSTSLWSICKQ